MAVLAERLLFNAERLLQRGYHRMTIAEGLLSVSARAEDLLSRWVVRRIEPLCTVADVEERVRLALSSQRKGAGREEGAVEAVHQAVCECVCRAAGKSGDNAILMKLADLNGIALHHRVAQ